MKFLHIALFVLAGSLIASKGFSQVSIHARIGIGVPAPVVVYQAPEPVYHTPYYGGDVVIAERRPAYGYNVYERGRWNRYERNERDRRDARYDRRDDYRDDRYDHRDGRNDRGNLDHGRDYQDHRGY